MLCGPRTPRVCATGWFAAALLCVSAATVSKEVGATAIGVFAAYDAVVVRGLLRAAAAGRARGPSRAKLSTLFGDGAETSKQERPPPTTANTARAD